MSKILFVTGTNSRLFAQVGPLMGSFAHRLPGETLWVADFGLAPAERDFLAQAGLLLPRPAHVRADHPWYGKAALLDFVRDRHFDALVWIDVDMVVVGDLGAAIRAELAAMAREGQGVAATPNLPPTSVADFAARLEAGRQDQAPFLREAAALGVDGSAGYINSGFFIVTDRGLLDRWCRLTLAMPQITLFEQHAFNLAVHEGGGQGRCRMLEPLRWNLHHHALAAARAEVVDEVPVVRVGEVEVLIAHATSERREDVHGAVANMEWEGAVWQFYMKKFGNHALDQIQSFYLRMGFRERSQLLRNVGLMR